MQWNRQRRRLGFIVTICLVMGLGAFFVYEFEAAKQIVKAYELVAFPNIYVNGTDVSMMTEEQIKAIVETEMKLIEQRKILIKIDEETHELTLKKFDPTFDENSESIAKVIVGLGKDLTLLEQVSQIRHPIRYDFDLSYTYDEGLIYDYAKQLERKMYVEKIEPTLIMESYGYFKIDEGKDGYSLNGEWLANMIRDEINVMTKEPILIEMNKTSVKREDEVESLKSVNTLIASYSSLFNPNSSRAINVQLAAQKVDQSVLRAGATFSYGETIEPVDYAHGFVNATTFYQGQKVPAVGGGICQVSSTLYNAQLEAGIMATRRQNHSLSVSYVPLGQDATYSEGSIDYQFKNTLDYPIYIHAYTKNGVLTVELWSNSEALKGVTYHPKTVISDGGLRADTTLYGYDASGNVVFEQFLHTSRYKPHS